MLFRLGISEWDAVLVGDGSGSKFGQPIGFACVLLTKDSMQRRVFHGAMNDATVNMAELLAYVAPLTWYANSVSDDEKLRVRHVHIITDSQYVQTRGESGALPAKGKNAILFAAINAMERFGLRLHWHWINRDTVDLNKIVDEISKLARIEYTRATKPVMVFDLSTANPWQ